MAVSWIWLTVIAFIAASLLHRFLTSNNKKKRLPPGPKGLPILGHLHLLGKNPHQDLHRIAQKHGPIMYMRFGLVPNVIVSSPKAAELFLKTHDLIFASRPPHQAAKYLSWDQRNLSFGPYGPYWRNMRKLCTLELLSNLKISSFQPMRSEELGIFIASLKQAARDGTIVDLSAKVSSLAAEMSCRMVFGKKVDKENEGTWQVYDDFFEKIINEHVRDWDHGEQTKDIVDTMMSIMQSGKTHEFQFDRRHVKAIMLDMLAGSMDTAASSVEWILSELLRNPTTMKKVQKELEEVVGLERMVEESDMDRLEYLDMVVKETFRLHTVAPLLIPHYAMEDCTVNGYDIPKASRIIINTHAIGRDPDAWSEPEKFIPERFIGSEIDVRGQHFQLLPFGSGRRGCPGMQLGLIQVRLIVSQLVHCFDWRLPNGVLPEELDMTEEFGLVVARANHLMAIPTLRLQI
ncbi:UNVERIFIED_CONTAM: cytochrome [Sesamum latifolium]|uniref:Cytochrome n=1 Tax=Sesamum latifolium TaxID=2727402 RepID=A0AAW2VGU1_9LAMI